MKVYHQLAPYYDRFMGHIDYAGEAEHLYRLLFQCHLQKGRVLDVGVGSGGHMLPLLDLGVSVDGLDYSAEMIDVLREKLREHHHNADLIHADMRDFTTAGRYDLIYCLGETLHHLGGIDDVAAFCRRAAAALNDGGILVYSWQEPVYFSKLLEAEDFYEQHGEDYLLWSASAGDDGNVDLHYTAFIATEDDRYLRLRETHPLAIFAPKELKKAAKTADLRLRDDLADLCFSDLLDVDDSRHITVWEKM